ncbi:PH domain-containing protein [Flavobacterium sp. W22_SRS_FK3]|uniref:PH domain-containing protein n=1 Tax=Flavobacterium sp. W22_SRS_FK3 TaxID=3240275 RepID=UPI003F92C2E6
MEKFKSKIDLWFVFFLGIMFSVIIIKMAYDRLWGGLVFMIFTTACIVYMFVTTFYIIEDEKLTIKCGFLFHVSIAVASIKKISETNNIMSSPALSFDRLEILYNKFDTVLISPKDKQGFMEAIQKINPSVEVKVKNKTLVS